MFKIKLLNQAIWCVSFILPVYVFAVTVQPLMFTDSTGPCSTFLISSLTSCLPICWCSIPKTYFAPFFLNLHENGCISLVKD